MRLTAPTWLAAAFLVGLRLVTTRTTDPSTLLHSLCLELLALALIAAVGLRFRWPARAALLLLFWAELLAAGVFHSLGAFLRGADLVGIRGGDVAPVVLAGIGLPLAAAFAGAALLALRWQPRKPRLWPAAAGAFVLSLCAIAALQQLRDPDAMPPAAHSPLALLFDLRHDPEPAAALAEAPPPEQDWAPPSRLAPRWQRLAGHPRFNIVLVVLESVGHRYASGPNFSALARTGVRFTRAYTHDPRSIKELDALLFGVYPWPSRANVSWHDGGIAIDSMPDRFRALGMHTSYFNTGDLGFEFQRSLVRDRFDAVTDAISDRQLYDEGDRRLVRDFARDVRAPFGAVLWLMQTHVPYWLPRPRHTAGAPFSQAAFEEALLDQDQALGELVEALRASGHLDDTVIALVGDHGQSFGEHAGNGLAHGLWLFEENTHVPLLLSNPRLFHGETDDSLVQVKDVPATLTWLAGDERPALNQGACVFFERPGQAAYLINFLGGGLRGAVVRGQFKYQLDAGTLEERLYDLQADPGEGTDVKAAHPAEVAGARARWAGWYRAWLARWRSALHPAHVHRREAVERALAGQP